MNEYPCGWGDVPIETFHRSLAVGMRADSLLRTEGLEAAEAWMREQSGIREVDRGPAGLTFRLDGGRPVRLMEPEGIRRARGVDGEPGEAAPESDEARAPGSASSLPPGAEGRGESDAASSLARLLREFLAPRPLRAGTALRPTGRDRNGDGKVNQRDSRRARILAESGREDVAAGIRTILESTRGFEAAESSTGLEMTVDDFLGWNDLDVVWVAVGHNPAHLSTRCAEAAPEDGGPHEEPACRTGLAIPVGDLSASPDGEGRIDVPPPAPLLHLVIISGQALWFMDDRFFEENLAPAGGPTLVWLNGVVVSSYFVELLRARGYSLLAQRPVGGSCTPHPESEGEVPMGDQLPFQLMGDLGVSVVTAVGRWTPGSVCTRGRQVRHVFATPEARGDLRIREVAALVRPDGLLGAMNDATVPIPDGTPMEFLMSGLAGDDTPDSLDVAVQVDGMLDDDLSGWSVHLELDGEAIGEPRSVAEGRAWQDDVRSRALAARGDEPRVIEGPYRIVPFEGVPLGRDVEPDASYELEAVVSLPEGGESRYAVDLATGTSLYAFQVSGDAVAGSQGQIRIFTAVDQGPSFREGFCYVQIFMGEADPGGVTLKAAIPDGLDEGTYPIAFAEPMASSDVVRDEHSAPGSFVGRVSLVGGLTPGMDDFGSLNGEVTITHFDGERIAGHYQLEAQLNDFLDPEKPDVSGRSLEELINTPIPGETQAERRPERIQVTGQFVQTFGIAGPRFMYGCEPP